MVLGMPKSIITVRSLSVTEDGAGEKGPAFQWKQSVWSWTTLKIENKPTRLIWARQSFQCSPIRLSRAGCTTCIQPLWHSQSMVSTNTSCSYLSTPQGNTFLAISSNRTKAREQYFPALPGKYCFFPMLLLREAMQLLRNLTPTFSFLEDKHAVILPPSTLASNTCQLALVILSYGTCHSFLMG